MKTVYGPALLVAVAMAFAAGVGSAGLWGGGADDALWAQSNKPAPAATPGAATSADDSCPLENPPLQGCMAPLAGPGAPAGRGPGLARTPDIRDEPRMPLIGDTAPAFEADTTQGKIKFPDDYAGKWVILFSHPADFTPVCTTEFLTFAVMEPQFAALNCKLIGLSIDSKFAHIAWLRTIAEKVQYKGHRNITVTFPVIEDIRMDVARRYGMVQPAASTTQAVRAVFFIDPQAKVRAVIYYPLSNGRNIGEVLRLLIAMQTSDKFKVATPADWQPGDDVIVPPPGSCGAANERVGDAKRQGLDCQDWFLCLKKLPKSELTLPAGMKE